MSLEPAFSSAVSRRAPSGPESQLLSRYPAALPAHYLHYNLFASEKEVRMCDNLRDRKFIGKRKDKLQELVHDIDACYYNAKSTSNLTARKLFELIARKGSPLGSTALAWFKANKENRPYALLWLSKVCGIPAGIHVFQVWGTEYLQEGSVKITTTNWPVLRECGKSLCSSIGLGPCRKEKKSLRKPKAACIKERLCAHCLKVEPCKWMGGIFVISVSVLKSKTKYMLTPAAIALRHHPALESGCENSLHQLRKQILYPEKHRHHILGDVKSHAGIAGNECVDQVAKYQASLKYGNLNDTGILSAGQGGNPFHNTTWLARKGTDSRPSQPHPSYPRLRHLPGLTSALKSHMHAEHKLSYADRKPGYYIYYQSLLPHVNKSTSNAFWDMPSLSTRLKHTVFQYRTDTLYN
eukprot:1161478-Pelagomonas_calceolata.AAC.2